MKKYLFLFFAVLFLGCSTKEVTVRTMVPAEVDSLSKKKNIAVIPFKNDNVNFTSRLESKLASVKINGKPYFNVVNRDRIGEVLKELKFQSSDLVGKKAVRFGKLAGAEIIITGSVKTTKHNGSYDKPVEVCGSYDKKGHCVYYKTVYLTCRTSSATFNATINAIDVNTARIVDAFNISKNYQSDSCKNMDFKNAEEALNELTEEAVDEYVRRIAPHYIVLNIELIDKVKSVDLNDTQEKMFENALTYIEHGRLDKAEYLLKKLNKDLNESSYEVAYDLGVVEEAQGKLKEAKAAYNLADDIIMKNNLEPDELVDKAIKRINLFLKEKKRLKEEL